jgi:hypothetical protein
MKRSGELVRWRRRKKVFLHIGFHKTGSTALQQYLSENREELAAAGTYYPRPLGSWPSHPELAWALCGNIFDWQDRKYSVEEVTQHYRREIDDCCQPRIVLSSEEFSRLNYYPGAIAALAEALRRYDLRIIAYLRSARDFLSSRYRHEVQEQSEGRSFLEYVTSPENLECAWFLPRLRPWFEVFGDAVEVRLYDRRQLVGNSIVPDFFDAIGTDPSALEGMRAPPESIEIAATMALFLASVNRSDIDPAAKQQVFETAMAMTRIVGRQDGSDIYEEVGVPALVLRQLDDYDGDMKRLLAGGRRRRLRDRFGLGRFVRRR